MLLIGTEKTWLVFHPIRWRCPFGLLTLKNLPVKDHPIAPPSRRFAPTAVPAFFPLPNLVAIVHFLIHLARCQQSCLLCFPPT